MKTLELSEPRLLRIETLLLSGFNPGGSPPRSTFMLEGLYLYFRILVSPFRITKLQKPIYISTFGWSFSVPEVVSHKTVPEFPETLPAKLTVDSVYNDTESCWDDTFSQKSRSKMDRDWKMIS